MASSATTIMRRSLDRGTNLVGRIVGHYGIDSRQCGQHFHSSTQSSRSARLNRGFFVALRWRTGQLMAQSEDLNLEFDATAETGAKGRGERDENGGYIAEDVPDCGPQPQLPQRVPSFW
jgi:hypothetical protein